MTEIVSNRGGRLTDSGYEEERSRAQLAPTEEVLVFGGEDRERSSLLQKRRVVIQCC